MLKCTWHFVEIHLAVQTCALYSGIRRGIHTHWLMMLQHAAAIKPLDGRNATQYLDILVKDGQNGAKKVCKSQQQLSITYEFFTNDR